MNDDQPKLDSGERLSVGGWVAIVVLVLILGWAGWYSVHAWSATGDVGISSTGWVFLVIGIVFTLAVGGGLMALLFYSSRNNFDR